MKELEEKPFLSPLEQGRNSTDSEATEDLSSLRSKRRWIRPNIILHIFLIVSYTAAALGFVYYKNLQYEPMPNAFAGLAVKHRPQLYSKFNESPFAGPPSPESDAAWHELMGNMSIRVTKEELDAHGQTSVELPGGGYLAWLGVFHELHCVKILRQWSYRDHYYGNMTDHDRQHIEVHMDHCIDWLRNAVMCHADISALAVFKWDEGPKPFLNTKRVPHMCVDWDRLILSHKERMVSHEEVAAMRNPNMLDEKS